MSTGRCEHVTVRVTVRCTVRVTSLAVASKRTASSSRGYLYPSPSLFIKEPGYRAGGWVGIAFAALFLLIPVILIFGSTLGCIYFLGLAPIEYCCWHTDRFLHKSHARGAKARCESDAKELLERSLQEYNAQVF